MLRERGQMPPVPDVVGVGERVSCHGCQVAELVCLGARTGLDVALAWTAGQLGALHVQVLISAGERLDVAIAALQVTEVTEPAP